MVIKYEDTKIYYIAVGDKMYYGHTAQKYLTTREAQHREKFKQGKRLKVYEAIREAGLTIDAIKCVWVEDYPCKSVHEARARERYYVENFGDLNMTIPTRTDKEWYEANKDVIAQKNHAYKQANKDVIIEKSHAYKQANKDILAEKSREYYEANRDKINEKRRARRAKKKGDDKV